MAPTAAPHFARAAPVESGGRSQGRLLLAAQRGDPRARAQLLEDFLPLIARVARKYSGTAGLDTEELVQAGVVGLLTALERYDNDLGTPFWAYASWWVRRMMQRLVADLTLPMVLSDRALRQLAHVKQARREHEQAHRCEPSSGELAESTGYTREQVDSLIAVEGSRRSLDEPLHGEEDAAGTLGELLADPRAQDRYEDVERELDHEVLRHRPNDLCERERVVLRARYGFEGPEQTLQEVGGELLLSAERVRQIQQEALGKLKLAGSSVV